jgi:ribonuclease H / adenosylcobalamin/alpha-ribazole phosphatase
VRTLILARHGEAVSNAAGIVSGTPPGEGLTPAGVEQARLLAAAASRQQVDLGVATEFLRSQQTLALALDGRETRSVVLAELNEIRFGAFDGGLLADYRVWAWTEPPDVRPPGAGESRAEVAARVAAGLELLLARPEDAILAVGHALPVRYVLDAAQGRTPAARIEPVAHATLHRLDAGEVERAADALRAWSHEPAFRDFAT